MFKECLLILLFTALGLNQIAHADFPTEEVWHVDLNSDATVLGPSWQDDEGQTFFLIGTRNRVLIVSEGRIVWRSGELNGWVSALNRIDFGSGDGPEIIAGVVEEDSGCVYIFSGENYREQNRIALTGYWQDPWWPNFDDSRRISSIIPFRSLLPDSLKPVFISNSCISSWGYYINWGETYSGQARLFSLGYNETLEELEGSCDIKDLLYYDFTDDGNDDILVGYEIIRWNAGDHPPHFRCRSVIGFRAFNEDLQVLRDTSLTEYVTENPYTWENDAARLFCMNSYTSVHGSSQLYVSYHDFDGNHLAALTLPDFENEAVLDIDHRLQSIHIYSQFEDVGLEYYLYCVNPYGDVLVIDITEFEVLETFDLIGSCRGSLMGNYDDDSGIELACLSSNSFHLFDVGPLGAPPDSKTAYIPEDLVVLSTYPNPFNNQTNISFNLVSPGLGSLVIFDSSGRLITNLTATEQLSAGENLFSWKPGSISSGCFLIQLNVRDKVYSKPIAYIK